MKIGDMFHLSLENGYFPSSVKVGEGFTVCYIDKVDKDSLTLKSDHIHIDGPPGSEITVQFWEFTTDEIAMNLEKGVFRAG